MKTSKSTFIKFLIIICAFTAFIFQSTLVNAEDVNSAGATGFTYSINFPDNQMDTGLGYFKLKVSPSQEQQVVINLTNPGQEKVTVLVGLNGAKTNQNGVIEYGNSTIKNDDSLKFDFTEIVTGPDKVELAAGESKELILTIKMPETGFDGILAGGIQLMRDGQETNDSSNKGAQILNQYAYVIGLLLQESDNVLLPDLALNSVEAGQSNYRNAIFVNFSNIISAYVNDMTVEVQIKAKGKDMVLYERKQTAMRMGPNTFIEYPIDMNGEKMVKGDYVADILVTSGDQKWSWTQNFKITEEQAKNFNERDMGLVQEKGFNWMLIAWIVAGVLAVVIIVFIMIQLLKKKREKQEAIKKKELQRKKRKANERNRSKES